MPVDYSKYPKNWRSEIRPSILARAKNKCEECGIDNYAEGWRDKEGNFITWKEIEDALENNGYDYFEHELRHHLGKDWEFKKKATKIVLTISHQDHDIKNNDPENLKALCQRCHLRHDREHHAETRRKNKEIRTGQKNLFK